MSSQSPNDDSDPVPSGSRRRFLRGAVVAASGIGLSGTVFGKGFSIAAAPTISDERRKRDKVTFTETLSETSTYSGTGSFTVSGTATGIIITFTSEDTGTSSGTVTATGSYTGSASETFTGSRTYKDTVTVTLRGADQVPFQLADATRTSTRFINFGV